MHNGGVVGNSFFLIDDRFHRFIDDINFRQGVFGNVAVTGNNQCDRFTNIANFLDGQSPLIDWLTQNDQEGF